MAVPKNNWGRWGAADEQGALNLVTADVTLAALAEVRTGKTISLAGTLGPESPTSPHRRPPVRFMNRDAGDYLAGARDPDGFRFSEDTVQFATHSGTHVDALSHVWSADQLYNGHAANSIRSTTGAGHLGADKLVPVVTRGVLVDMVSELGAPLAPSRAITPDEMLAYCAKHEITVRPGDGVLFRTGWSERGMAGAEYHADEPGISIDLAEWLAEHDVSLVGADNYAVEVQPSPAGATFPVHLCLLHRHGIPLIENLALAPLATQGRQTFLLVFAPLALVGSTGSPVNPLAVL